MHRELVMPNDADVLICAGDITVGGTVKELLDFANWLGDLPYKYKIVVAGNHDYALEQQGGDLFAGWPDITYLEGKTYKIPNGPVIYGAPWQPRFTAVRMAFNRERGKEMAKTWAKIPLKTDILVTHGPPLLYGDYAFNAHLGDLALLERIKVVRPKVHVCGHVHGGYGTHITKFGTVVINAANCTPKYNAGNVPLTFMWRT